mmetsp:Transcript_4237/g.8193  ORF Transcript_4237/g.8193 Transcript_4237/m.8193 type:complete len:97 (-) Transcript_4237:2247-2537(-)
MTSQMMIIVVIATTMMIYDCDKNNSNNGDQDDDKHDEECDHGPIWHTSVHTVSAAHALPLDRLTKMDHRRPRCHISTDLHLCSKKHISSPLFSCGF